MMRLELKLGTHLIMTVLAWSFQVAQLVAEEFFQQGDREAKELNMTPMVQH